MCEICSHVLLPRHCRMPAVLPPPLTAPAQQDQTTCPKENKEHLKRSSSHCHTLGYKTYPRAAAHLSPHTQSTTHHFRHRETYLYLVSSLQYFTISDINWSIPKVSHEPLHELHITHKYMQLTGKSQFLSFGPRNLLQDLEEVDRQQSGALPFFVYTTLSPFKVTGTQEPASLSLIFPFNRLQAVSLLHELRRESPMKIPDEKQKLGTGGRLSMAEL